MEKRWSTSAVLMALLAMAASTKAVTIVNLTTSTVLFSDNFESGGFNPSVGNWTIVGPDVAVTNAASPGPAEGSFYATLFRNSNENDQGNVQANMSASQATLGDIIRLSMMVLLPADGVDARAQLMLDNGDFNSARAWVQSDGAGHVIAIGPGTAATDTGLVYTPGVWQEWDLQYAIGTSTFSVTVNGVTASGLSSFTTGSLDFADLFNGSTTAGSFYLDAVPKSSGVPEPGAFLLAAAGLFAISVKRQTFLTSFGRGSRH